MNEIIHIATANAATYEEAAIILSFLLGIAACIWAANR